MPVPKGIPTLAATVNVDAATRDGPGISSESIYLSENAMSITTQVDIDIFPLASQVNVSVWGTLDGENYFLPVGAGASIPPSPGGIPPTGPGEPPPVATCIPPATGPFGGNFQAFAVNYDEIPHTLWFWVLYE